MAGQGGCVLGSVAAGTVTECGCMMSHVTGVQAAIEHEAPSVLIADQVAVVSVFSVVSGPSQPQSYLLLSDGSYWNVSDQTF